MKKSLILLSGLFIMSPLTAIAQDDNQADIEALLAQRAELDADAQAIYDRFMTDIEPIQQKAMDIDAQLAELGYVTIGGETDNAVYEINNMYMVENSMFPGEQVVAIELTFTNKRNQPASPWISFATDYAPEQVTGQTTELLLGANGQLGNIENQDAVNMGDANINAGETVEAIIGVRMVDPTQPVNFILNTSKLTGEPEGFAFTP